MTSIDDVIDAWIIEDLHCKILKLIDMLYVGPCGNCLNVFRYLATNSNCLSLSA